MKRDNKNITSLNILIGSITTFITFVSTYEFSRNYVSSNLYFLIVLAIITFIIEIWVISIGYSPFRKAPNKKNTKLLLIISLILFIIIINFIIFLFLTEFHITHLIFCYFLVNLQVTLLGISELLISSEKIEPPIYKSWIFLNGITLLIFSSIIYIFIWENTIFFYSLHYLVLLRCSSLLVMVSMMPYIEAKTKPKEEFRL